MEAFKFGKTIDEAQDYIVDNKELIIQKHHEIKDEGLKRGFSEDEAELQAIIYTASHIASNLIAQNNLMIADLLEKAGVIQRA